MDGAGRGAGVTPDEALALLGVGPDDPPETVRSAYRARVLASHPDRHDNSAVATATTAALNEALRVLRGRARPPSSVPRPGLKDRGVAGAAVAVLRPDGDSIAIAAPADDVFGWILDAVDEVGTVTYVDVEEGLIEAQVREANGNLTSVVVTLQGRADGTTEAFCSADRLTGTAPADLAAIVDRLVDALAPAGPS